MPFSWAPAPVTVAQFAARVRDACTGVGHITVAAIGYEYSARDGVLYRIVSGNWRAIGDAMEMIALSDHAVFETARSAHDPT